MLPSTILNLTSAKVGTLSDHEQDWPGHENLFLDGFTYDRIDNESPQDAERRKVWLHRQPSNSFSMQPYEQLAKTLIGTGRQDEAAEVMIAKNKDYACTLPASEKTATMAAMFLV